MKRRRWYTPKSLTPRRGFELLMLVVDTSRDAHWRLAQVKERLEEHVKFGLERARRRSKPRKKATVIKLAGGSK